MECCMSVKSDSDIQLWGIEFITETVMYWSVSCLPKDSEIQLWEIEFSIPYPELCIWMGGSRSEWCKEFCYFWFWSVQLSQVLCLAVAIGHVEMSEDELAGNIHRAINFLVSLLKKNWQNVRALYVKSTMGKAHQLYWIPSHALYCMYQVLLMKFEGICWFCTHCQSFVTLWLNS